jgi:GntR family transcriptional regulator
VKKIVVGLNSSVPPWVQIKEHLKLAYAVGQLREGDVLPSIRSLARELDVGDAIVRRAYEELTELGFLSAQPRRHLMVSDTLSKTDDIEELALEVTKECDRMVEWAHENGLSAVSMARIFQRRATEIEQSQPTYLYVDGSQEIAEGFAEVIAQAWEIPVRGIGVEEAGRLPRAELDSFTAILVNAYRHPRLLELFGPAKPDTTVLPIRVRLHRRLIRKIRRLPAGSSVLFVLQDGDANVGRAVVDYVRGQVGDKVKIRSVSLGDVPDLADEAEKGDYRLVVVSAHLWNVIPEKARRLPCVVPNENELLMESLEKARVRAGALV